MIRLFDLQLFADEGSDTAGEPATGATENENGKAEEPPKVTEKAPAAQLKPKEAKYTDEDVDRILDKKFAKWQERQQKAVDEAKKLAEMNATQKAEYERDQLQKELDALKKAAATAEMMKTARKMLAESGF